MNFLKKHKGMVLVVIAAIIIAVAAGLVFANRTVDIIYLAFRDDITVAPGETMPVDFVVGTEKVEEQAVVTRSTEKLGLSWSVDDESIAVYEDGLVRGVSEGETVLRVSDESGELTAECVVRVDSDAKAESESTAG